MITVVDKRKTRTIIRGGVKDSLSTKKAEYNQKVAKNRRVRGILSRKIDEKQKSVENLKNRISDLLETNPDLKLKYNSLTGELKQDFEFTLRSCH